MNKRKLCAISKNFGYSNKFFRFDDSIEVAQLQINKNKNYNCYFRSDKRYEQIHEMEQKIKILEETFMKKKKQVFDLQKIVEYYSKICMFCGNFGHTEINCDLLGFCFICNSFYFDKKSSHLCLFKK